jgi:pyrimidine deaminase RibD-like protein
MATNTSLNPEAINPGDHETYMRFVLSLADKSPPKPTNYRVGALLLDVTANRVLATGYTLELAGNTHAEQCCFQKLMEKHQVDLDGLSTVLPTEVALYTTVEPCSERLSGNMPCVDRIVAIGNKIKVVYVGVQEPEKFVSNNSSRQKLSNAGIECVHIAGMEDRILAVATAGHV